MAVSPAGFAVCIALLILGRVLGSAPLCGTVVSIAFGSTAVVTLPSLGGSSPLIYVVFAALLCASQAVDPSAQASVAAAFRRSRIPWVVAALGGYACASAFIMPRLFAGQTNVFVASRDIGVVEVMLTPTNGNITQTGYFVLGCVTFVVVLALLLREGPFDTFRRAFLAWAIIDGLGGAIDVLAKASGAGDVLFFLRSASFAMLTDVGNGGFSRIAGMYSEASAFAAASLPALAFTYADWRRTGSPITGLTAVSLFSLLALSTSSTAYAGLAVLAAAAAVSLVVDGLAHRLRPRDGALLVAILLVLAFALTLMMCNARLADQFQDLFQSAVINKADSASGRERAFWNQRSLESLVDTVGLGVGFGSSRASNWAVAVASQFGVIGSLLQGLTMTPLLLTSAVPLRSGPAGVENLRVALRACLFGLIVGNVISGGTADPGLLFFIALAGLVACDLATATKRAEAPWQSSALAPCRVKSGSHLCGGSVEVGEARPTRG